MPIRTTDDCFTLIAPSPPPLCEGVSPSDEEIAAANQHSVHPTNRSDARNDPKLLAVQTSPSHITLIQFNRPSESWFNLQGTVYSTEKKENCLYGFEAVIQAVCAADLNREADLLTVLSIHNINLCGHMTVFILVLLIKKSSSKQTAQ